MDDNKNKCVKSFQRFICVADPRVGAHVCPHATVVVELEQVQPGYVGKCVHVKWAGSFIGCVCESPEANREAKVTWLREQLAATKMHHNELRQELAKLEPAGDETVLPMSFDEYQAATERTANRKDVDTDDKRFANFGMGLAGEAGETCDLLKKHLFHGQPLDREKLIKEMGDVLWYLAALASTVKVPLSEVAERNIIKLKARYPEGFDVARSTVREGEAG